MVCFFFSLKKVLVCGGFFPHALLPLRIILNGPFLPWQSSFPLPLSTPPPDVLISGCVYAGQILGLMMANLSEVGTA